MDIEAVLLAAGFSSRADCYKMLLNINGKTLIERSIETFYELCSRIYVVVGYKRELLDPILRNYNKVETVFNKDYADGMFSSVKKGLSVTRQPLVFFSPGDYPLISKNTCKTLLEKSSGVINIPVFQGKKGHPILLTQQAIFELLANNTCQNLREYIYNKGFNTIEVEDSNILIDIDTQKDYKIVQEGQYAGS